MPKAQPRPYVSVPTTRRHSRRLREREWPRSPRRDPHTRVVAQLLELIGPESSVIATSSRPWASATFQGTQHRILVKITGGQQAELADRLADTLPEAEFSIAGHIVADACIDERKTQLAAQTLDDRASGEQETQIRLSVLTIEDW